MLDNPTAGAIRMTPITSGCVATSRAPASCSRASTLASGTNQAENQALMSNPNPDPNQANLCRPSSRDSKYMNLDPAVFRSCFAMREPLTTRKELSAFRIGLIHIFTKGRGAQRPHPPPSGQHNACIWNSSFACQQSCFSSFLHLTSSAPLEMSVKCSSCATPARLCGDPCGPCYQRVEAIELPCGHEAKDVSCETSRHPEFIW